MDFILEDYKVVKDIHIYNEAITLGILRNSKCIINANSLRETLKYFMGGNATLKEYLDHIKKRVSIRHTSPVWWCN